MQSATTTLSSTASPIAFVGTITMLAAYAVAAYCVAAGIAGNARKSRRLVTSAVYGLYGFGALVSVASALVIYAFVTHDYAIKYVAMTSDTSMATWYKVTAFWGGLDGSLLFWVLVLALFSMIAIAVNYKKHRDMIGYVVGTIMVVQVFFMTILVFHKNPFATFLNNVPMDGQGLNPLLQNYWMVIHPPSLYIGFVSATIPFAFGIGALASGRLDDLWLGSVRVWMLICFFFLSLGNILGGRWAYEELGWGGYWAWDPVENTGLMPWFCATAFLHSAIIQEQKGMMKGWNMILMFLTMFFTIFGTFMTRSGIVQSVHAFGEDNVLALQFVLFLVVMTVVTIGLIVYRWQRLSSKMQFESFTSREFSFLLNNWILLACAFFVFFATMFPTIKESMLGERATVGISFFNKAMPWGGLSLLFLAGASPLLAWRKTTLDRMKKQFMFPAITMAVIVAGLLILVPSSRMLTTLTFYAFDVQAPIPIITLGLIVFAVASIAQEFVRGVSVRRKQTGSDAMTSLLGLVLTKRRKYGGYIIHLGVAVLFLGFVGKAYDSMIDRTITRSVASAGLHRDRVPPDDPAWFAFQGYKFLYEDLQQTSDDHKSATTATVSVWKDGERLTTVFPAQWNFVKGEQPTTEVAIHPRLGEDVYLVLTSYNHETGEANFRVFVNPLINFVWLGFLILALGTFICLIPAGVVNALSPRPQTRLGRAADVTMLVLILGALTAGLVKGASAAELPSEESVSQAVGDSAGPVELAQAAEHDTGAGMGDGEGHAHKFRPRNDTEATIMKELICMCGGCQRETVFECKCGYAANEREKVQQRIAGYDLTTAAGRDRAKAEVMESFVKEYGNEQVLATPRNKAAWMVPVLAAVGGLGLLVFVARTWVGRGRQASIDDKPSTLEDETYAEKLDDELANVD
ncbi:MAG: cytochrome c biogenesis protein CcsA [Kofleriaceae bacterium]|nr:cytochrome c biogenesis protein CcsA [Kofleriaceae bacterium]